MFNILLKHNDIQNNELSLNTEEYNIMVNSMLDGFINNYENDIGIKGISLLQVEYFLFSLAQA